MSGQPHSRQTGEVAGGDPVVEKLAGLTDSLLELTETQTAQMRERNEVDRAVLPWVNGYGKVHADVPGAGRVEISITPKDGHGPDAHTLTLTPAGSRSGQKLTSDQHSAVRDLYRAGRESAHERQRISPLQAVQNGAKPAGPPLPGM
jgi:hypothetical protein